MQFVMTNIIFIIFKDSRKVSNGRFVLALPSIQLSKLFEAPQHLDTVRTGVKRIMFKQVLVDNRALLKFILFGLDCSELHA